MPNAWTLEDRSPGLVQGVERAQRAPAGRFHVLAPLMDGPALTRAYRRQRSEAAVGVDGVTKEQYGQNLEATLQDLHARLKAQQYRHQPIRRVHIPKGQGKTRRASLRRAKQAIDDWCRRQRHQPVEAQHAALGRRRRGHCNSCGVSGNVRSLLRLVEATKRAWYKWRYRRSQRQRLTGERLADLLRQKPLPHPRITVRIWGV